MPEYIHSAIIKLLTFLIHASIDDRTILYAQSLLPLNADRVDTKASSLSVHWRRWTNTVQLYSGQNWHRILPSTMVTPSLNSPIVAHS